MRELLLLLLLLLTGLISLGVICESMGGLTERDAAVGPDSIISGGCLLLSGFKEQESSRSGGGPSGQRGKKLTFCENVT